MSLNWHLVSFKQGQDLLAARALREQNFNVYLAKIHTREKIAGRVRAVTGLRLSPYGFVQFDRDTDQYGPIRNTRGVAHLFCDLDERPQIIKPKIISTLRSIEDEELFAASKRPGEDEPSAFKSGCTVRIDRHDDFKDIEGTYIASERGEALVVVGFVMIRLPEADLSLVVSKKEKKQK